MKSLKIKKGDTVVVMTGTEKGKKGKVVKVMPDDLLIIVEGVRVRNVLKRSAMRGVKPQMVAVAQPLPVSNVMVVDSKTGKPSRVGYSFIAGKKVRVTKKSNQEIK